MFQANVTTRLWTNDEHDSGEKRLKVASTWWLGGGRWTERREGTKPPRGKPPKAADSPLYLSVVNTHQRGWGSITPVMIGIVSPRARLVIEPGVSPVRRSTPLDFEPISIRNPDGSVTINAHFPTTCIDGHHHKSRFRPGERIMAEIWTLKERT